MECLLLLLIKRLLIFQLINKKGNTFPFLIFRDDILKKIKVNF
jgi:hypothetical protein